MPKFCTKCGAETGNGRFCLHCGNRLDSTLPAPVSYQLRTSKPGAGLKIALSLLVLIAIVGIGSLIGIYYYAKNRIHARLAELKQQSGVDIPALIQDADKPSQPGNKLDACLLLPKRDAEGILGFALIRTDRARKSGGDEHCDYYTDPGTLRQARASAAANFRSLVNSKSMAPASGSQMENLVKSMSAGANDGSVPVLQITFYRGDANTAFAGYRLGTNLMGGKIGSVPGPWDEAIFGPMNSTLAVRKGDSGVLIDLRQIPNGHDAGLAIARVIAPRL